MVDRRFYDLVRQLHKKTREGRLSWETAVDAKVYQVILPRSATKIEGNEDRDIYRISVTNQDGIVVDSFTNRDLDGSDDDNWSEDYTEMMRDIYKEARRMALSADRVIDEVLAKLAEV